MDSGKRMQLRALLSCGEERDCCEGETECRPPTLPASLGSAVPSPREGGLKMGPPDEEEGVAACCCGAAWLRLDGGGEAEALPALGPLLPAPG